MSTDGGDHAVGSDAVDLTAALVARWPEQENPWPPRPSAIGVRSTSPLLACLLRCEPVPLTEVHRGVDLDLIGQVAEEMYKKKSA